MVQLQAGLCPCSPRCGPSLSSGWAFGTACLQAGGPCSSHAGDLAELIPAPRRDKVPSLTCIQVFESRLPKPGSFSLEVQTGTNFSRHFPASRLADLLPQKTHSHLNLWKGTQTRTVFSLCCRRSGSPWALLAACDREDAPGCGRQCPCAFCRNRLGGWHRVIHCGRPLRGVPSATGCWGIAAGPRAVSRVGLLHATHATAPVAGDQDGLQGDSEQERDVMETGSLLLLLGVGSASGACAIDSKTVFPFSSLGFAAPGKLALTEASQLPAVLSTRLAVGTAG